MADKDDKLKFWAMLAIVLVVVAVTVTLVDLGIKAAILEQANAFRRDLERARNGQAPTGASSNGVDNNSANDGTISGDVLDVFPAGMEEGSLPKHDKNEFRRALSNWRSSDI
jgi:hypothetical protein